MLGAIHISVKNQRNSYDFTLKRNITILKGNSGSGKTTLYEMIRDYNNSGKKGSGVSITCDKDIVALEGNNWEQQLESLKQSIVVVDEGSRFIYSQDFAEKIKGSDNYFLIITRNYLSQLPYSVEEIYCIKGRGKNKTFEKIYKDIDRFYDNPNPNRFPVLPDVIITEDSNSGFQFFQSVAKTAGIKCVSANGKSNIVSTLKKFENSRTIVVADGAAIGAEIESIVKKQELSHGKLVLFLPESFEWLILKSGVVSDRNILKELNETQNYADSKEYMSWEQYFTALLKVLTADRVFMRYDKRRLNDFYKQDRVSAMILNEIPHTQFGNQENE